MLFATLQARNIQEAFHKISQAKAEGADGIELRLDLCSNVKLGEVIPKKILPTLVTCRPTWEGGQFPGAERERLRFLQEANRLGADFIDVELKVLQSRAFFLPARTKKQAQWVLSVHNFERTPSEEELMSLLKKMRAYRPDFIKIATKANSIKDVLTIAKLLSGTKESHLLVFPMGEYGEPLRILYRRFKMPWMYVSLNDEEKTALGQLSLQEMHELYRVDSINRETSIYGLLGNPVHHSKSPLLFNTAFRMRRKNARYIPFAIDEIDVFEEFMRRFSPRGLSVTLPHKISVMEFMDEVDETARAVGAVNTIIFNKGCRKGYNTDAPAALQAIQIGAKKAWGPSTLRGRKVLILGAGGVARAVTWALQCQKAKMTIANRTFEKARRLACEFNAEFLPLSDIASRNFDIIVNATSVGMTPHESSFPITSRLFHKGMVVFDCVYTPAESRLLREAKKKGATTVSGVEMFLCQAAIQYKLFINEPLPTPIWQKWRALLKKSPQ